MSDTQHPADAGEQPPNPAPAGETPSGSARETDNASAAELRILRKQLKEAQQRLSAADQAAADKAKAEMTELERYKSEAEQYRKQAEETHARFVTTQKHNAVKLAAQAAGVKDVEAAIILSDLSTLDLDGDQVIGVDAVIASLRKARPYLFEASKSVSSAGGNPSSGAPSVPSMTIAEFSALRGRAFDLASAEYKAGRLRII